MDVIELAERIVADVKLRIRAGTIPNTVKSFAELHKYCDANELGAIDLYYSLAVSDHAGDEERQTVLNLINEAQEIVTKCLSGGYLSDTVPGAPTLDDMQWAATRTENDLDSYKKVMKRLQNFETVRLLHAAMGLASEAGEFVDALKKHIFYGIELDKVNLFEEGGDVSWYLRIAADALKDLVNGCSFEKMINRNIRKLQKRYPNGFSEQHAVNRDLAGERSILEGDE